MTQAQRIATLTAVVLFASALVAQPAGAADAHPIVAGFERFHAGGEGDAATAGRLLISELNCTACHAANDAAALGVAPRRAPLLGDAGDRFQPEWLAAYLSNPQAATPGVTMPHLLAGKSDVEKKKLVEPLVHYLVSLRGSKPIARITGKLADGVALFNQVGCAACHAPIGADAKSLSQDKAVLPIGNLAKKYKSPWALAAFLLDPLHWRPSGRMPSMNLTKEEALSIAMALAGPGGVGAPREPENPAGVTAGLFFEYYEDAWGNLPDWDKLKPVNTGTIDSFTMKPIKREENVGLRFRGYIDIQKPGVYTFYASSDDGSRLTIGDMIVVDNDGTHGTTEAAGAINLKQGRHAVTVEWFNAGGPRELAVNWEGPGIKKSPVPAAVLGHLEGGKLAVREQQANEFPLDAAKAAEGKKLFAQLGCAACHQLNAGDKPIMPVLEPKPLASLKGLPGAADGGCLSAKPTPLAPYFALSAAERSAIKAALASVVSAKELAPAVRVTQTMEAFNCYACHARQEKGGPEPGRDKYFTCTGEDMGDEGRLPPHLGDVGRKLTADWLRTVLDKGEKVRPYMPTRMPQFGLANVGHLVDDFMKADATATPQFVSHLSTKDAVEAGRQLTGKKGMSCITCHRFNNQKSLGIQAMDLAFMPKRLQRDWFNRYLINPVALRPGTRMPTFWPGGKSVRTDILDGNTDMQIEALWAYLSQGGNAPPPPGLNPNEIILAAHDGEALMYRNFIEGAGTRAIGVAYPQRANLAWDANEMRLALIWQGDFIDASKHWVGRGPGFQGPYGVNVVKWPVGAPLAVLPSASTAWPSETGKEAGFQFGGYKLDKARRPTFLYRFKDVQVTDYFEGKLVPNENAGPALTRTLTFEANPAVQNLWFRAAAGFNITAQPDGSFRVGNVTMRIKAGGTPIVRKANGGDELLVPVTFNGGKATVTQEFVW
jgi:cytochrome c551/c552